MDKKSGDENSGQAFDAAELITMMLSLKLQQQANSHHPFDNAVQKASVLFEFSQKQMENRDYKAASLTLDLAILENPVKINVDGVCHTPPLDELSRVELDAICLCIESYALRGVSKAERGLMQAAIEDLQQACKIANAEPNTPETLAAKVRHLHDEILKDMEACVVRNQCECQTCSLTDTRVSATKVYVTCDLCKCAKYCDETCKRNTKGHFKECAKRKLAKEKEKKAK